MVDGTEAAPTHLVDGKARGSIFEEDHFDFPETTYHEPTSDLWRLYFYFSLSNISDALAE